MQLTAQNIKLISRLLAQLSNTVNRFHTQNSPNGHLYYGNLLIPVNKKIPRPNSFFSGNLG